MEKESKEVFSNLETLSAKLELKLQEDHIIKPLSVPHKGLTDEDLMELEVQRKDRYKRRK